MNSHNFVTGLELLAHIIKRGVVIAGTLHKGLGPVIAGPPKRQHQRTQQRHGRFGPAFAGWRRQQFGRQAAQPAQQISRASRADQQIGRHSRNKQVTRLLPDTAKQQSLLGNHQCDEQRQKQNGDVGKLNLPPERPINRYANCQPNKGQNPIIIRVREIIDQAVKPAHTQPGVKKPTQKFQPQRGWRGGGNILIRDRTADLPLSHNSHHPAQNKRGGNNFQPDSFVQKPGTVINRRKKQQRQQQRRKDEQRDGVRQQRRGQNNEEQVSAFGAGAMQRILQQKQQAEQHKKICQRVHPRPPTPDNGQAVKSDQGRGQQPGQARVEQAAGRRVIGRNGQRAHQHRRPARGRFGKAHHRHRQAGNIGKKQAVVIKQAGGKNRSAFLGHHHRRQHGDKLIDVVQVAQPKACSNAKTNNQQQNG